MIFTFKVNLISIQVKKSLHANFRNYIYLRFSGLYILRWNNGQKSGPQIACELMDSK